MAERTGTSRHHRNTDRDARRWAVRAGRRARTDHSAHPAAAGIDVDRSILTVDLCATDEQLVQAFKSWLAVRRKLTGPRTENRAFTDKDFQGWTRWHVLPYIDLILWSRFRRTRIGLAAMCEALFPNESEVDTTDRVRRTTQSRAEWLMRDEMLSALRAQPSSSSHTSS